MINTVSFSANKYYLFGKAAYSILIGIFGTIFIVLFLTTLTNISWGVRFIPWVIAFNTALTGYSIVDKARESLKHKQISSVAAGIINVSITYTILNYAGFHLVGEYLLTKRDLIFFLVIGIVCSKLGAMLAIKYLKLKHNVTNSSKKGGESFSRKTS